ncbi:MAG: DoxX family membrane protein [Acidobacteriota bacterium]
MAGESGVSRAARNLIAFYLRLALGVDFLSAVADRFGLWGPPGAHNVTWGNFPRFINYTAQVDPFASAHAAAVVAWVVTALELLFGALLILGLFARATAFLSGILLAMFAVGMSVGTGAKSAFDASMFTASAGAFALAALGSGAWSIDARKRKQRAAAQPPSPASTPASTGGEEERPSGG